MQTVNESFAAQKQIDIKKIVQYLESRRCKLDLELINTKSYKAIVLTDPSQFIIWVNSGFTQMTGYSRKYAVGKKPTFLQGKNTSEESKKVLSQQIASKIAFMGRVINYKLDGTEYKCEVEILPIFNERNELKAYLGLESEVL